MPVHGHLTVNGEKMSKTRGTFINAATYLEAGLDPELLRYFFAANLGPGVSDLDLSLDEFRNRINADLQKRIANLAARVHSPVARSHAGGIPAQPAGPALDRARVAEALAAARAGYAALDYRAVLKAVNELADVANKAVQDNKPWESPEAPATVGLLHDLGKVLHALAVMLGPVMPRFAAGLAAALDGRPLAWPEGFTPFDGTPVRFTAKPPAILPLEPSQVEKLIQAPPPGAAGEAPAARPAPSKVAKAASPNEGAAKASAKAAAPAPAVFGVIQYDDFAKVELRVAAVRAAVPVPKADKLLQLTVDVGEAEPRTIVAGIAQAYPDPAALVGRRIVVVANLAPRPLRGITSQGMLLAAGEPPNLQVVTVGEAIAPGTRVK
jgi:methionyl-tRNA synthetase